MSVYLAHSKYFKKCLLNKLMLFREKCLSIWIEDNSKGPKPGYDDWLILMTTALVDNWVAWFIYSKQVTFLPN